MLRGPLRERIHVTGVVQGVGFRPHVHRIATELALSGFVGNDSTGVVIEVEGSRVTIDLFVEMIVDRAPPLAVIHDLVETDIRATCDSGFRIIESEQVSGAVTLVPPDVAVCDDCVDEMRDPDDRRFGHPFITCTNCGPRFTIIRALPYDRPNTTMAGFAMCGACAAEYSDPQNRRYHAQPIACHDCGPRLRMTLNGVESEGDVVERARHALAAGMILAIKGIGGYHLACDATNDAAVGELRRRKGRSDKPFAVMVADLEAARAVAAFDELELAQLVLAARPIVLVRALADSGLSGAVAPGNPLIGLMLPYSPLHHLLLDRADGVGGSAMPTALVMTSGNRSGEPIAHRDDDARRRLADLADGFVVHDRAIHVPCDDSVVRVVDGECQPIRRSRGFAPMPVRIPTGGPHLLAVGGELKNTFAVCANGNAWVSQHIGDMENLDTMEAFKTSVAQFTELYRIQPVHVVVDAHPAYLTSKWARLNHGSTVEEVQHHHAHIASVMAEHQLAPTTEVIGIAFDGTGYGTDGAIWGGEVLVANAATFTRVAHLRYVPLPGGDAAVRHPCRVALSHLWAAGVPWVPDLGPVVALSAVQRGLLVRQFESGFGCVPTSSMGRLFDAVSSLVGIRHSVTYEAQAAIELEIASEPHLGDCPTYAFPVTAVGVDCAPVIAAIAADVLSGIAVGAIGAGFHHAVAALVGDVARRTRSMHGLQTVALTGGVFQNAVLTRLTRAVLVGAGFDVLTHRLVPANDGGLALGQAFIGSHRARARNGG